MYDAEFDNKTWEFGTSGWLWQSNKLMYDRFTNTMWHSLTGEPVIGELVGSGLKAPTLPVTVLTWEQWLEEYPDSTVLSLDTGHRRNYFKPGVPGSAYYEYFRDPGKMFPTFEDDDRMEIKDRVLGLSFDGQERAYPLGLVTEQRVINDVVGNQPVVVVGIPEASAVRAFDPQDNVFTPGENLDAIVDQNGGVWHARENGLFNEASGQTLPRIHSRELFWFAWTAFFPETDLYE